MWTISVPLSVPVSKRKSFSLNLNIYRNAHYQTLNKAKTTFTDSVITRLRKIPTQAKIALTYTIFFPNNRKADISNIGSIVDKFFSDALVDAGVIPDDNYTYLTHVQFFFGGIDRIDPRVEITITPIDFEEKENDMRIFLTKDDLQAALKNYINDKIVIKEGQEVDIEFTDEGVELFIGEKLKDTPKKAPAVEDVVEETPAKRTRRTKAEMEAARAEEEQAEPEQEIEEEEEEQAVPVKEEPEAEEEEKVEETKPKAKSLFGGLNRPKN